MGTFGAKKGSEGYSEAQHVPQRAKSKGRMLLHIAESASKQNFDGKINCYVANIGVYGAITIGVDHNINVKFVC